MRSLTSTIRELDTTCGRFWIFHDPRSNQHILCIRKYGKVSKVSASPNTPPPWDWETVGRYPSLAEAKLRADDHVEGLAKGLEWI